MLFGGPGGEHTVSVKSAKAIFDHLDRKRFSVLPIFLSKNGLFFQGNTAEKMLRNGDEAPSQDKGINIFSILAKKNFDLVFPIIHGDFGEDGRLQALLDFYQVPYLFSGFSTAALTIDKFKTKMFLRALGINSPHGVIVDTDDDWKNIHSMTFPLIAKPVDGGSSVGIFLLKNNRSIKNAKFKKNKRYLIEEFITGRELTVTVMGNRTPTVLAITEIIPTLGEFYDYNSKYKTNGSRHLCPAILDKEIERNIKSVAVQIYQAVGCQDLARIDFILNKQNALYFIEVNTVPGMTETSLAPEAAKFFGLNFQEFLSKLILDKLKRS